MKRFDVRAEFHSGLIAYDKAYIYTDIADLAKVLEYKDGSFDEIHIYSDDPFKDKERIKAILPDSMVALGWWEQKWQLFLSLSS